MAGKSLLLLFNHTPTCFQEDDARRSLGVDSVFTLPEHLRSIWNSVPPELEEVNNYLEPLRAWVAENSNAGDFILIQGDFGATYLLVKFAFDQGLIPVYSTTDRDAVEEHSSDGSIKLTRTLKHKKYRRYGV